MNGFLSEEVYSSEVCKATKKEEQRKLEGQRETVSERAREEER